MKLYLMQHGESKSEQEDPKKPLSDQGKENVSQSAELASRLSISPAAVLHSGKLRAQESAEIVAKRLTVPVRQAEGLSPNDPVDTWKQMLAVHSLICVRNAALSRMPLPTIVEAAKASLLTRLFRAANPSISITFSLLMLPA